MATKTDRRRGARAQRPVYADTSAFIAFLDRSDSHHALYRRLFAAPPPITTSALVVAELHGWFLRRYDLRRAIEVLTFLESLTPLTIEPMDAKALASAVAVVKRYQDQVLTLADAHGIALLQAGRFERCWSTDQHLKLGRVPLAE
jgi:predicted nucleic acid-binding protein